MPPLPSVSPFKRTGCDRWRPVGWALAAMLAASLVGGAPTRAAAPPAPARFVRTWGSEGTKPGEFYFPIGVAVNADDEVFVTDHYNSRVQKFDAAGKLLAVIPVLPNPGGIAADESGNLYIVHFPASRLSNEKTPDRVSVYNAKGEFVREWGRTGAGDGEFDFAGGVALDRQGSVYVADQTNRRVQVFDRQGKFLFKWGKYGVQAGEFGGNSNPKSRVGGPQFLAFDGDGKLYTTEATVFRVQKFTPEGQPLLAWQNDADRPGGFGGDMQAISIELRGPIGICVDRRDRVWVSAVSGRIQQFDKEGKYLGGIGDRQGTGPGEFSAPHGLAVDGQNRLYVVDSYNHRVQQFELEE